MTITIDKNDSRCKLPENRIYHMEIYTEKPEKICDGAVYDETKMAVCFTMKADESFTIG